VVPDILSWNSTFRAFLAINLVIIIERYVAKEETQTHRCGSLVAGFSDPSYRGEACQPLDLDLVDLEVKGHFRIRKVQPEV
jgi:hypothetical protein